MNILRLLKSNLPIQVLIVLLCAMFLGPYIPLTIKETFFAISTTIKQLLVFVLPFIIFSLISSCLLSFKNGAVKFIVSIFACIIFLNFFGSQVAYVISHLLTNFPGLSADMAPCLAPLTPTWDFDIAPVVPNTSALLAGLLVGLLTPTLPFIPTEKVQYFILRCKYISMFILGRLFIPVVPLFILGFMLKMQHEGLLGIIIQKYAPIFLLIAGTQALYILSLYLIAAKFNISRWTEYLKNMFPAAVTAISSMSSAASMPFTLKGVEKNTGSSEVAHAVVPTTVNIHLMGDAIGLPLLALATLVSFGMGIPDWGTYFMFSVSFVFYLFSVAGVPGGTMYVMIPVLESILGFTPDMISVTMGIYILFDAIGTMMNVVGNGVFALLYSQLFGHLIHQEKKDIKKT